MQQPEALRDYEPPLLANEQVARSGRLQAGSGLGIPRGVMIESVMYFGIGFLIATLLGLLFIPLVHNRAVRLTMKQLEASMPLSLAEMHADKEADGHRTRWVGRV